MKIAIVGLSSLGKRWTEVLGQVPDVELIAFVDPLVGIPQAFSWLVDYPDIPKVQTLAVLLDF
jgi:hypothetical protein